MEYDINRNGSGYYDPTAYKAIKRIMQSEEKAMNLYKGDIFDVEMMNGITREAVILSVHEKYSTILMLTENDNLPWSVSCRGLKFTDPGMIQYAYNDKFKNYIRSMKEDEVDMLMQAVVESLGYEAPVKEIVKENTHEHVEYIRKGDFMVPETELLKEDLTKAQAERDVYKSLYDNLISSMIAK